MTEEVKKDAPVTKKKKTVAPKTAKTLYTAKVHPVYHPFQKVYIPLGAPGIELIEDEFIVENLKRGIIAKL